MKLSACDDPKLAFKCRACEAVFLFSEVKLTHFVINPLDSLGEIVFVKPRTEELARGGTGETSGQLLTCPNCNTVNLSAFGKATAEEAARRPDHRKLIL